MSDRIERPWALMRHHAGWADVFHIENETADSITGFYPDRETVGPPVNYSVRAVLARFPTMEAARAAREGAVLEWRKHDAAVREAEDKLRAAEKAREDAWLTCLRGAANGWCNNLIGRWGVVIAPAVMGYLGKEMGGIGPAATVLAATAWLAIPLVLLMVRETRGQDLTGLA